MRGEGIANVLVAGLYSQMAVGSTVRQGFDLGYTMVVPADACAGPNAELHERATHTLLFFGRVIPVGELCIAYFGGSAD